MLRLSRYIVPSDDGQRTHVYSTRSGEVVTLSRDVWGALLSNPNAQVSASDLELLRLSQILVPAEEDELAVLLQENATASASGSVFHLIVVPTSACPLGCNSARYGGYCGQHHGAGNMSEADQDSLVESARSSIRPEHHTLSVAWFGAEPLAALPVLRRLTNKLRALAAETGRSYAADLVTGGTLLTPAVARECALELDITAFSLSLDGPARVHDQRRCTKAGKPTFDTIVAHVDHIVGDPDLSAVRVAVRCNVDERNADVVPELIKFATSKNWQQRVDLYFARVHQWGDAQSREVQLSPEAYALRELEWIGLLLEGGFRPYLLPERKKVVCRVVSTSNVVVGHDGRVHKCTESPLTPSNAASDIVGRVGDTGLFAQTNTWDWHGDLQRGTYPCTRCEMLPVCGGGCPLAWQKGNIPCPPFKFTAPQRIKLHAQLMESPSSGYAKICQRPGRGAGGQYDPSELLLNHHEAFGLDLSRVEMFVNLLWSARRKAQVGKPEFAQRQYEMAQFARSEMLGFRVGALGLAKAAEAATEAYLKYRQGESLSSLVCLEEAIQHLAHVGRRIGGDAVLPAQVQALVNMAKVLFKSNLNDRAPLLSRFDGFFARGEPIEVGAVRLQLPPNVEPLKPLDRVTLETAAQYRLLHAEASAVQRRAAAVGRPRRISLRVLAST